MSEIISKLVDTVADISDEQVEAVVKLVDKKFEDKNLADQILESLGIKSC